MTGTEERLRDVLDALAEGVHASPGAYRAVQAEWRRRERRRRLLVGVLAALVIAVADGVGLWALNQARPDTSIIFDEREATSPGEPAPGVGQP